MNEINLGVQRGGGVGEGHIQIFIHLEFLWGFFFAAAGLKTVYEVDPTDRGIRANVLFF